MMSLYEIVRQNGTGKGESVMWKSVERVSDFLEEHLGDSDCYQDMLRGVYADMAGEHFNEEYGRQQIEKMSYADRNGNVHRAPYWTDDEMHQVYENVKRLIPDCYTEWDFNVTLNMIKSDYANLIESWFPDEQQKEVKYVEMAVAYLNDEDSPHRDTKIWSYFC